MDFVDFSCLVFVAFVPLAGLDLVHLVRLAGFLRGLASHDVTYSQCFLCEVNCYFEVNALLLAAVEPFVFLSLLDALVRFCSLWP